MSEASATARRQRGVLVLLFVLYLAVLVWIVLWKLHAPALGRDDEREIKLVPLASSGGYGSSSPFELLANVLIFIPLGAYLRVLAPRRPAWTALVIAAATSIALEVTQFITATGSSDVTDVITNTVGAAVGIGLIGLAQRRMGRRATTVVTWFCIIGTVIGLLAVAAYASSLPRLPACPESARPNCPVLLL